LNPMRVALLYPLFPERSISMSLRGRGDFPLGLGYIAACLKRAGHTVSIFIPDSFRMPMKRVWRELEDFKPDLVGISALTQNFMEARLVAGEAKRRFGCPVIMGGPHPTALPRSTLLGLPELDAVIVGEGELPMLALAEEFDRSGRLDLEKVPGAAYLRNGEFTANPRPEFISDLDALPYPAMELLSGKATPFGNHKVLTSRGCPGQCNFCANICMGKKFRPHSPERVVAEIERLVRDHGAFYIQLPDDCFSADPKRVHRICDLIIEKRLKVYWEANGRVNTLQDEELVAKMKRAGCERVLLGIETGSQKINDIMRKGTTLEMAEKCCALMNKHGIGTFTTFIIGNEGETLETIGETLAFSRKIKSTIAYFTILIPYPGTPIFEKYYKDFDRPDMDWTDWCSLGRTRPCEPRQTRLSHLTLWFYSHWGMITYLFHPAQMLRLALTSLRWMSMSK